MKQRSILEVWDYRLSTASPMLYCGIPAGREDHFPEGTPLDKWVVAIYDNGENPKPLAVHVTSVGITGGIQDHDGYDACYEWLRSVRDEYSRDDIEDLKPKVAKIRIVDIVRQKATEAYNKVMQEGAS